MSAFASGQYASPLRPKRPTGKNQSPLSSSPSGQQRTSILRTLLPLSQRHVIPLPLPLITTVGGRYSLFLAIDGEDETRIIGGESDFGNTATLEGFYQVLEGLERVGSWVREVYVPWFVRNCLPANSRPD
jgi:hypothetical protein